MAASGKSKGVSAGSGMKGFYIVLAVVAVVGMAALGYAVVGGSGAATEPVALEGLDDPQALLEKADGQVQGAADAPVTVIEFGDYQCPACGVFATRVKPFLKTEYIDTGRVRFVYYDFPLTNVHANAFLAARAARCAADQDRYWAYHDRLFGAQSSWAYAGDVVDELVGLAEEAGLEPVAFEECVESARHADVVSASRELAVQLGVNATPTVLVNGKRLSNTQDYSALKSMIEEELGG